jgi:probable F420-dependent oxidoreductase
MDLSSLDIWTPALRNREVDRVAQAAAEIETLGYRCVWLPGREAYEGPDAFDTAAAVLGATTSLQAATGVLNIWAHDPAAVAARTADLETRAPGRFLLGLGVSHAPAVEARGDAYVKPLARMVGFLDRLDAADPPVRPDQRVLAALRPRMLELSRDRAAGAHPYLAPPEHTAAARATLGAGPLLVPEQTVVLDTDATSARATARQFLATYLDLPNYVGNLLAHGFDRADVEAGGSDRLVDRLVPWGTPAHVLRTVGEHLDAGADRVAVQVATSTPGLDGALAAWRDLAAAV